MTDQEIRDIVLVADGYILSLMSDDLIEQRRGCSSCGDLKRVAQLVMLKEQLLYKVSIDDYSEETASLYSCMLDAVAKYSGASISVDPNSKTPGVIIDVTIPIDNTPMEMDVLWSMMIPIEGDDGRLRYENSLWAGWVPLLEMSGGVLLQEGNQFTNLADGGFVLYPSKVIIYEGGFIRANGFVKYVSPLVWDDDLIWDDNNIWVD